ncbi:MAG: phytase [Lentisphaeria bacterium]|nr:phytase [Lentisphaeria bacterium]NQZ69653.1 phytase [Lentisphaeria bacterium]
MKKIILLLLTFAVINAQQKIPKIGPRLNLKNKYTKDQDDVCIWEHPSLKLLSTFIVSDKKAQKIFVYDFQGKILQTIPAIAPGNIDIRYNISLAGSLVDVVVYNQRAKGNRIVMYTVDPNKGTLSKKRADTNKLFISDSFGSCLYKSPDGKLYSFITSKKGIIQQYELIGKGAKFDYKRVRTFNINTDKIIRSCESCVVDDEAGILYVSSKKFGIYAIDVRTGSKAKPTLIVKQFDNNLRGFEGIDIYYDSLGNGYILLSSQDNSSIGVLDRKTYKFLGKFKIMGARKTDGIAVSGTNFGGQFTRGLFVCHTDAKGKGTILVSQWAQISSAFKPVLRINTRRDPRAPVKPLQKKN